MNVRSRNWLAALSLLVSVLLAGESRAMETEEVVRLHVSGYSEDDILEVIAATQSEFLLGAADVVYLNHSGITDRIVQHMLVALPLDPDSGDQARPVRLPFTGEDLQLLADNRIPEAVVITFIESREMAFTLDTPRLTALRDAGMGLDALQLLVERSAANSPGYLAPPLLAAPPEPAPVMASGTGYDASPTYFYGRSGTSTTHYAVTYQDFYAPPPSMVIRTSYFPSWLVLGHGWGYRDPRYFGGYYGSYYGGYPSYGHYHDYYYSPFRYSYYPRYGYGYPFGWSGYHGFHCPRGPHRHDHDGDRDHDRYRDRDRSGVYYAGGAGPDQDRDRDHDRDDRDGRDGRDGRGKGGTKDRDVPATWSAGKTPTTPVFSRDSTLPVKPFRTVGAAKPVPTHPVTTRPVASHPITTRPVATNPITTKSPAAPVGAPASTFQTLGTQPLYGRTAAPATRKPPGTGTASARPVTVRPVTVNPVQGLPSPTPTVDRATVIRPGASGRSVTGVAGSGIPRSGATFTSTPAPRAPVASAAPAVAAREDEGRSGGFRARAGDSPDGGAGQGGRRVRPR